MKELSSIPTEVIYRKTCRVCDSPRISTLYSLGDLYISTFVERPGEGLKAPLEMVICENCSLVQLRHTAPQEFLYTRFYWYRSGVTDTMRSALGDITAEIERALVLKKGDIVVDIGSNDGTLLRTYTASGLVRVGVEPATNLAEEGKRGLTHFIGDFWGIDAYRKAVGGRARVITAIGMFYDMEDPNQFIRDAAAALRDDGIFVAQLMCLKHMFDTQDVGNICHEHLEYYSLGALDYLFQKHGLEMIDISHNAVNGGSYRITCRPKGGKAQALPGAGEKLRRYREEERDLERKEAHLEFYRSIAANKERCVNFIRREAARGKRIWVYGASTKGNTILQYFGLDHTIIECAAERSPEKWGKFTVGTHIPIASEKEARKAQPDYFLVLPYAFFNEFYEREKAWRQKGGKFIVPLPEFRVVS